MPFPCRCDFSTQRDPVDQDLLLLPVVRPLRPTQFRKGFANTLRHRARTRRGSTTRLGGFLSDTLGGSNPRDSDKARFTALLSPGRTNGTLSLSIRPPSHAWYHSWQANHCLRHFRQDRSSSDKKRSGREHARHGATIKGGAEYTKEGRCFSKTLERAARNFCKVIGESGGGAREPPEPRGVGGIKAITGKTSLGTSKSEEDIPIMSKLVDRPAVDWKFRCTKSSTPGIYTSLAAYLTFSQFPFDSL